MAFLHFFRFTSVLRLCLKHFRISTFRVWKLNTIEVWYFYDFMKPPHSHILAVHNLKYNIHIQSAHTHANFETYSHWPGSWQLIGWNVTGHYDSFKTAHPIFIKWRLLTMKSCSIFCNLSVHMQLGSWHLIGRDITGHTCNFENHSSDLHKIEIGDSLSWNLTSASFVSPAVQI